MELTNTTPSPAMETFTPTVNIALAADDLNQLKGVKVGDRVRVTIVGTVKDLIQGEGSGSFGLETKSVKITGQPEGVDTFKEMAEDD